MELKELIKKQISFSESRDWHFHKAKIKNELFDKLGYMAIALSGETGEFANLVKKVLRQHERLDDEMKEKMKEEVADIFIYCLLTSSLLEMDLEKEFLKKLEKNEKRFPPK
jgi:dCTP diphosphatase